jgi:predicted nucleic acid-binding protein
MTTSLVIDAGFAFKLILPGPYQPALQQQFTQWLTAGNPLYAPTLWLYELTSAFNKAVHTEAITVAEGLRALHLAQQLNVQLIAPDEAQIRRAYECTRQLDRATAYDSFYLALAESLSAELWTADKRLYYAANRSWLRLIG